MGANMGLNEYHGLFWIYPGCHEQASHFTGFDLEYFGILWGSNGMQVHHTIDAVIFRL
jgi:hypothetical protein